MDFEEEIRDKLGDLNRLVGERHRENKLEFRQINQSIIRLRLQMARRGGGNHMLSIMLNVVSILVVPVLVVWLTHVWK